MVDIDSFLLLLQINDAAFPIGGYAHSFGLETYIQKRLVKDGRTAFNYVKRNLLGSFLYTELLSAFYAYDYAKDMDCAKLRHLDLILRSIKVAKEIRFASEKLGIRFIKTIKAMDIKLTNDIFFQYCCMGKKEGVSPNYSVAYGALCACAGIDKRSTLGAYIYSSTSALVTNCVKAIPLSQMVGQKILIESYPILEAVLEAVYELEESNIGRSMPGFEIRCMQHETLYSRQYMS